MVGDGRGRQRQGRQMGTGLGMPLAAPHAPHATPPHPTGMGISALDSRTSRKMCKLARGGARPWGRGCSYDHAPRGVATESGACLCYLGAELHLQG